MRNFNNSGNDEFLCKGNLEHGARYCGCKSGIDKMDAKFLIILDNARDIAGVSFTIVSGYRCPKHNADVGSKSTNHVKGVAADIAASNSRSRYIILTALLKAGFNRCGIGKTYIHADCNSSEVPEVVWLYGD